MINGVIYARYSSERQTEQSIEGQLSVCRKYATENGIRVVQVYVDRAMTGTNDNRADFQRMLRDSALKQWEVVIVYKLDRFSRNRYESAIHKKTLKDNGVRVLSAMERIDSSSIESMLLESMLEGYAEYYSAELSQKVKRGIAESRKKGYWLGGFLPFGYDVKEKKPVLNEYEAQIVKEIYSDYVCGAKVKDIVAQLAARGVRKKDGKALSMQNVYKILHTQYYNGNEIYPQIVSDQVFEEVKKLNEENKRSPARKKAHEKYLLSGKLFCGECGDAMCGESGTSKNGDIHLYYKCVAKKKHKNDCSFPSIKKETIETAVFDVCVDVLHNDFIQKVASAAFEIKQEETNNNLHLNAIEKKITENEKARANLIKALETGIISEGITNRIKELEQEISYLKCSLESEKLNNATFATKEQYAEFLCSFLKKQSYDESLKQGFFDLLVRKVVVFRDKLCVSFNFSPDGRDDLERKYTLKDEVKEIIENYNSGNLGEVFEHISTRSAKGKLSEHLCNIKSQYWSVLVEFSI
jgi:DNA invertase Pin-like site-specific DNA recombinase